MSVLIVLSIKSPIRFIIGKSSHHSISMALIVTIVSHIIIIILSIACIFMIAHINL